MNIGNLIAGNLCSLLAMIADSISSTQKTAKRVLLVQTLGQVIYCISGIVLKGYSGAAQNAVSILRNLIAIKNINSKAVEWTMVVLGVVLGICCNNLGWVGFLPIVGNLQYTLAVFRFKDNERALKISFLFSVAMFTLFNCWIYNIVGVASNLVIFFTTLIFVIKTRPKKSETAD